MRHSFFSFHSSFDHSRVSSVIAQVISILQEGFRHRKKAYSKYFSNFNTDVDYPSNTQWYCSPLLKHLITHDLSHTDNILEKCWAGKLSYLLDALQESSLLLIILLI